MARRIWTIAGILALALVITPNFFPETNTEVVEKADLNVDVVPHSFLAKVLKLVQARHISEHPQAPVKHL